MKSSRGKIFPIALIVFVTLAARRGHSQAVPAISSFSPNSGLIGTSLAIAGTNFSATAASNIVFFGAVRATVLSASATTLTVAVPAGATFGPITVTAGGLTAYSSQMFEPTFLGNGSNLTAGSFAPSFNLPGSSGPQSMVIADLDGDGKPDLAFVNGYNNVISIYRNIGTNGQLLGPASFAPRQDLAPATNGVIGNSYRLRAVDLDGDGKLDLIVSDYNSDHISIFHNVSTPGSLTANSFEAPFTLSVSQDSRFSAAADLDGDGRVDIVVLNYGAKTISIFKNIGTPGTLTTNSFAPPVALPAPGGPYEAVIADLDGDGKPDLAVANADNGTVSIYQNQAVTGTLDTNSFAARVDLPGGTNPETIAAVDLDGDGRLDLVTGSVQSDNVNVYRNLSTGGLLATNSFASEVDFGTPGWMHTVSVADFNGDGKPDLGVCGELGSYMAIFQNTSTPGSFTVNSFAPRVDFSTGWNAWGIAAGDLDGDGRPDIVFANYYDNTVQIYQNQVPFGTTSSCTPAPAGLVGWWKAEGNANDSSGTNNGTLSATGAAYAPGEVGQGFRFDGTNGYVQIPDSTSLKPANVTVEAWVWLDPSLPPNRGGEQIVFKKNTATAFFEGYSLLKTTIDNGNGTYADRFQFVVSRSGNQVAINSQTIAQRGIWYHVAATYDGNQSTLYVNGVAEASATPGFALDYDTTPVFIGSTGTWPPYLSMFGGIIDEASIYNRALGSNEIAAIYSAGSAGKCSNSSAPYFTLQPANQTVTVSNQATFTVAAGGTQPLSYQWSFNGTNILDATNSSLTLNNVLPAQAGNYSVLVTNLFGTTNSAIAMLTINTPPTISSQSPNEVVLLGSAAIFSVTASGSEQLSYFWSRNGVLIPDATNSIYTLMNAQLSDSGSEFSCLVTNAYGAAASTNVSLKVIDTISNDLCSGAVVIASYPYTNTQSTFNASSYGDPVPDCIPGFGNGVWYQFTPPVDGQLVVDTFGSDFDTGLAVYTGDCGNMTEVACNDDTGGVTSQVILPATSGVTYHILAGGYSAHVGNLMLHLNFLTTPAFLTQPADQTVLTGSNANFSATLIGALPMNLQWYFNGNPLTDDGRISGSLTANLVISNATVADAGSYTLSATNYLGSTNSAAAALTVLTPPSFTMQPVGRSVPPGLPTTFNASAFGVPAPSYQWQLNGTNLPPGTSSSYTIPAVGTNDLGFYQVVASNFVGVVTSAVAQLTFGPVAAWGRNLSGESLPPPGLSNVIAVAGNLGASFAVKADGTIVSWGTGSSTNVPASASNVIAIATSDRGADFALRTDGTVVGWGGYLSTGLSNIVSVVAGYGAPAGSAYNSFDFALRAEGAVTNIGQPYYGWSFPATLSHVTAIAAGYNSVLALKSDGTVVAAGTSPATNVPVNLANVTAIAAGYTYAMALKADGTVAAWGSGTGTNMPAGMTNIAAIAAGNYLENSGMAIRSNGTVVVWGDNNYGDKIPPAALSNLVSVAVSAPAYHGLALVNDGHPQILRPPVGLTAYTGRDVTLKAAAVGAAPLSYQWLLNGTNVPGATNTTLFLPNIQFANVGNYQLLVSNFIATTISLPAPVTVISNNTLMFLTQSSASVPNVYQGGKVTFYGGAVLGSGPLHYQWFTSPTNRNYVAVPGATNDTLALDPALAVQSGNYYLSVGNGFTQPPFQTSAVTSAPVNLTIYFARAWGFGAVSNPPVNVTNAIAVATGGNSGYSSGLYLALSADGKVSAWANNFPIYGETNVSVLTNYFITAIAAGYEHALAVKSDGTVYAWGYNGYGQTNVPAGLNGVVAVACGGYHDLALKSDGTVVGWGDRFQAPVYGQATNNPAATNVVAIAAGSLHSLALRADGTVVAWGYSFDGTTTIPPSATNVVAIAAGSGFSVALRANGTVVEWGNAMFYYPVPLNLSNVVAISASGSHASALRNDGTAVSWGNEYVGLASNNVPPDLANVVQISSGGDHDFALLGTRAPIFTVQPWNRTLVANSSVITSTAINLAGKCVGVQPMSYQWRLNGTNVPNATNDTLAVRYNFPPFTLPPEAVYQLIASNAYGVTASRPAKVTWTYSLGYAVNATGLNWTTSGDAPWFGETNVTHDGVIAAQSGGIGPLQQTILQTTVATNWSGRYTFWWKVSSEQGFDILDFRVNGVVQTNISGEVDWQQVSIPAAAGTNALAWRYSKDATIDAGQDAGWVDQFAIVPDPPIITLQPVSQTVNLGTNVTFQVTAIGQPRDPLNYQWRQNGNVLGSAGASLNLNNVGRAQNGTYFVTVSDPNSGTSTVSSNAVLKVLVPQQLGAPTLSPNGTLTFTSTDANGGLLQPSDLANFEAQASTNLVNWATLPNALSLTNGMLQLQDNSGTNWPARFYRILEH